MNSEKLRKLQEEESEYFQMKVTIYFTNLIQKEKSGSNKEPKSYNREFELLKREFKDREDFCIEYLVKWEGLGKYL